MTLKAGRLGHGWHMIHLALSIMTRGVWLVVYAIHAIVATVNRPTVTMQVPEGYRIEYRDGSPNLLAPDEYLEPRSWLEQLATAGGYTAVIILSLVVLAYTR